jgi:hypothetical protein
MINICLIGYGKWGKKIFLNLKKIKFIKKIFIIKNKKSKIKINFSKINWIFIAADTKHHFELVSKYIKLKINVFCEKPLTYDIKKNIYLQKLAKKNKVKLYISDIENWKNIKLSLSNSNIIQRCKYSKKKNNIIFRLAYHDFTYIYKYLKCKSIKKVLITKNRNGLLEYVIYLGNKKFLMKYNLNSKKKQHLFNSKSLLLKKNILKKMLEKILLNKINIMNNWKLSNFASTACHKIKKKLKKNIF